MATYSDLCPSGETWTMFHIVKSCPLTNLNGGLSRLHSADEDAISWLTSYGSWHAYEKKKTGRKDGQSVEALEHGFYGFNCEMKLTKTVQKLSKNWRRDRRRGSRIFAPWIHHWLHVKCIASYRIVLNYKLFLLCCILSNSRLSLVVQRQGKVTRISPKTHIWNWGRHHQTKSSSNVLFV